MEICGRTLKVKMSEGKGARRVNTSDNQGSSRKVGTVIPLDIINEREKDDDTETSGEKGNSNSIEETT